MPPSQLTGIAAHAKIGIVGSTNVPPEPAAVSMSAWKESFWTAVNERGWRHALREVGWRPALKILGALIGTAFAELSKGTSSRLSVKSTGDVTREVLAELDVTPPPGNQEQPMDGDAQAASVAGKADRERAVTTLEPRERADANLPRTRPAATKGRERTHQEQPTDRDTQASSVASMAGAERLLRKLEQRERAERDSLATRLAATKGRERILYAAHLLAALLTVVLAFSAVGLVFVGLVSVAVASAAVAIIPGSGTFLLRKMWDKERSKQEILEASRNEHAAMVDAVEGALSLSDSQDRDRLVAQLAERLVQRAFAD